MSNFTSSKPGWAFASTIAWRNEPAPLSFVLITVKVEACTERAASPAIARERIALGTILIRPWLKRDWSQVKSEYRIGSRGIEFLADAL